ncbi:hypothetical protein [Sphingobium sp. B2]|uniref:hypothetical protein n=1 Tax=Sphingobium sp. B2 TaxID=2583228 RepID=UPI00119E3A61|nr:hypothetical protein [Sphingobium sp. B2]
MCIRDRPRTTPTGAPPSTGARHAIPATASPRDVYKRQAQNNTNRRSAIDRRATRHPGYGLSQRCV